MTIPQSNMLTGGTCALLKTHAGIVLEKVVREAVHLLGGMGLTKGGTGERIERIWREVKALTVPGGSEDVMIDLGVRQQLKLVGPQSKF
ncbi:hypothetical protein NDA16_000104 [Ustilago loliicola]|nr:hypothetical protein NDA16_000104 [Ustilago loliicola]